MAAEAMDDIAGRFAGRGVSSVFVYTREAHPAENYGAHRSMDDKRDVARAFVAHSQVSRPILLDDLEGSCHVAFGRLPNMTFIIGPGGLLMYKGCWTSPPDVADALVQAIDYLSRRSKDKLVSFYSERLGWRERNQDAFRAGLERNGPQAVQDFYGD